MIRKLLTKLYSSTNLYTKLVLLLLMTSIIPIALVQFISYQISSAALEKQAREYITMSLQQTSTNLEEFFLFDEAIMLEIYTDSSYSKDIRLINQKDEKKYDSASLDLRMKLESIAHLYPEIFGIAILGTGGEMTYYDSISNSSIDSFYFAEDEEMVGILSKEAIEENCVIYSNTMHGSDRKYGERNYFYIIHPLNDFNHQTDAPIGSIILCVNETALREVYTAGMNPEENMIFLVNQKGNIVSFPQDECVGIHLYSKERGTTLEEAVQNFFKEKKYMDTSHLEVYKRSIRSGAFTVVSVQNMVYVLRDIQNIFSGIILYTILVWLVCTFLTISFATATQQSFRKIMNAMKKVDQGDYNVYIALEGKDEFAQIAECFNDMITQIRDSMSQEKDALVKQKNAEIRSLEAQINPHFLYNTLDAINWVAVEQDQFEISKMLVNLAAILRYSIQRSNEIVTLQQELDYIKKYLYLQQERFGYSFDYEIEVEESLLECKIHKLLFQPLVENSISHAFPGNTGHDQIRLIVHRMDEVYIRIQVKDNGKGMTKEQVNYFNCYLYRKNDEKQGIGVGNVISRLKLYYGDDCNFYVESGSEGTIISVVIPYNI